MPAQQNESSGSAFRPTSLYSLYVSDSFHLVNTSLNIKHGQIIERIGSSFLFRNKMFLSDWQKRDSRDTGAPDVNRTTNLSAGLRGLAAREIPDLQPKRYNINSGHSTGSPPSSTGRHTAPWAGATEPIPPPRPPPAGPETRPTGAPRARHKARLCAAGPRAGLLR